MINLILSRYLPLTTRDKRLANGVICVFVWLVLVQQECAKYFPKYFKYFDNHAEYMQSWLQNKAKFDEKQKAREQKASEQKAKKQKN